MDTFQFLKSSENDLPHELSPASLEVLSLYLNRNLVSVSLGINVVVS